MMPEINVFLNLFFIPLIRKVANCSLGIENRMTGLVFSTLPFCFPAFGIGIISPCISS